MAESGVRQAGAAKPAYFPLFVNMERKKILVFGAGQIAARRVSGLLRFGADVTVIAPQIQEKIRTLYVRYPGQLQIEECSYCPGRIQAGYVDYVLAATNDSSVNTAIAAECRSRAIPVNHAGDHTQCDFYFPALVEQDGLVIGMTSRDGDHKKTAEAGAKLRRRLSDLL